MLDKRFEIVYNENCKGKCENEDAKMITGIARLIKMEITGDYDQEALGLFSKNLARCTTEVAQREVLTCCAGMWVNDDTARNAVCEAALRVSNYGR